MPGAKVFLSYKHNHSRSDVIRRQLEAELIQHGYCVLIDETLRGGDRWPTRLYEWVLECAAAVVLASPEAKASDWCQREWHVLAARAAADNRVRVIPVCIDLHPSELAVLKELQAIEAGDDLVTRVLAALADVPAWAVTPDDYLVLHQAWNRYQFRQGPESEVAPAPVRELFDEARLRETVEIANTTLCRWVFILDGWDEVSLADSAGYQAQLRTWLPKIREFLVRRTGTPVRLVITGRPSLEVKDSGFLSRNTPVLTLRLIRPDQLRAFANKVAAVAEWGLTVERCEAVFERDTTWFDSRGPGGVDMLGLPLLAFLTFRTLANWSGDIAELISAPSALYCALIDQTVAHSGKAVDEGLEGTVHRGGESLCLPKIHLNGANVPASIGPFNLEAWERRKVLGIQRGEDEMMRECCGADKAIRHAHTVTEMEAFKPCQRRAGCLLCEIEEPILAQLPGQRALLPSIAASRQQFKVRND
jgi:TIR domain